MQNICERADAVRKEGDDIFQVELDDHKLDVTMAKEDAILEIKNVADEMLYQFEQSVAEIMESAEKKLDKLEEKIECLNDRETMMFDEKTKWRVEGSQHRRATSSPL